MAFFRLAFTAATTPLTPAATALTSSGQKSCTSNSTPLSSNVPGTVPDPRGAPAARGGLRRLETAFDRPAMSFDFRQPFDGRSERSPGREEGKIAVGNFRGIRRPHVHS